MNKLWMATLLVAFLIACSGSDKEPVDVTAVDNLNVGTGDVQVTDDAIGDDSAAPDVVPEGDLAVDQTVDPVSPYSDGMLEQLCNSYCDPENGCDGVDYGPDCVAECVVLATADETIPKKIACAKDDDEGESSFCERYEGCAGDYEYNADCVTLCDDVEACDALGTEIFGNNLEDCALVCSGSIGKNPAASEILACIGGALETCSGTEFLDCVESEESDVCEVELCGPEVDPFCSPVPDTYPTVEECAASCESWSTGQTLAAEMCLERGLEMPFICADLYNNCLAVPAQPLDDSLEYCEAYYEKCGVIGENSVYQMLGGLGHDFCAWQMTGFVQMAPEGFRPMDQATTCVESLELCPSGNLSQIYCLLDITSEHVELCSAVADICTDPAVAADVTLECEAALGYAAAFIPEVMGMLQGCIDNSADCDTLAQCFFGDEEGEGNGE